MLDNRADAYQLLKRLGAPARLLLHLQLVGEAADLLMRGYADVGLDFDAQWIELGVAVHDAGKITYPKELMESGALHEPAGKALLLQNDVQPKFAECCVSHAAWRTQGLSLEELSVALADKLWKGKREEDLELLVIDQAAQRLGVDRWEVFETLDSVFEEIAAGGSERLDRSKLA
ncbi:hypothetical protein [Variovorax sp. GB1P17]|uniref:hypothetical protein n=1 Tax=Variovorax sp. GB1P17 TaxID=3443740 RepID=UPI003F48DBE8